VGTADQIIHDELILENKSKQIKGANREAGKEILIDHLFGGYPEIVAG